MSNIQTTQHDLIPFKVLTQGTIDKQLVFLGVFLERLLSLQGEVSKQRMKVMLPMMKDSAWSLSLSQVRQAFTMYVQGKLPLEPKTNFLDIILFNKVVSLYRQQMKQPKTQEHYTSPEEIEFIMTEAVDRIHKDYKQNGRITEMCHHVYDHLFEQGKLPKEKEYKDKTFIRAIVIHAEEPIEDDTMFKKICSNITTTEKNEVVNIAKRLVLEDYFKQYKQ